MIIHGVVQTIIKVTKVVTLVTKLYPNRPIKIRTIEMIPMKMVACTRLSFGNTLEKSSPVPYNDVEPVDMPPIMASSKIGSKNNIALPFGRSTPIKWKALA